ncbi:hypothetical protein A2U01_0035149, partial [Trifolium medium]|nr:hypothetical protein [Trifolium medium]
MFDWFEFMFKQAEQDNMEMIVAITYGVWYSRNQLVFQEKHIPPNEVSIVALIQLQEYKNISTINSVPQRAALTDHCCHNTSWSPPPRGTLKINVDAHLSSDGHWFSRLILRRSDGSVVGAATRSHAGSEDVVFGKALGLNNALD